MGKEYRGFGPPGTGKTTWLSRQIENAVHKHGSENILVASFTKAAAAELTGRNLPIDEEQIGTLHAHCYRMMNYPRIAETYINHWNEYAPQYQMSIEKSKAEIDDPSEMEATSTDADELYLKYQTLRAKMIDRKLWPTSVLLFAKKWEYWKKYEMEVVDFTDMIEYGLNHEIPPRFATIGFFDEVQDFTPLELALVRKWAESLEWIIMMGDDDQCLYNFKGATPEAFLNPPLPDDQIKILDQSYRVPREVQKLAQKWIKQVSVRQPKEYKPRDEDGEVRYLKGGTWKTPEFLMTDAENYLNKGKTVMFLAACGYMLEPLKKCLRQNGYPFHNPYRRTRGDWNPLSGGRGTSSSERLLAYLRPDNETWGEYARMWTPEDLHSWVSVITAKGILQNGSKKLIEKMVQDEDFMGMKLRTSEMSIDDLLELFTEEGLMEAMKCHIDWFLDNLLSSKQKTMQFPVRIAKKYGAKKLMEDPQIIIGTIHSVKGGEADVVYLFPDISFSGMREWITTGERKDAIIRQFYVGMTRARESLIICSPATNYAVELI